MSTPRHMFSYTNGDDTACITTTAETREALVAKFEDYLKACGFHFEGWYLALIPEPYFTPQPKDTQPYPPSGYVPPVTDDLTPSEDKETST